MDALSSGTIFPIVLGLMLIEASVIVYLKRYSGSVVFSFVVNLMAGAGLLGAMILMLYGAAPVWIGIVLCASLIAHVEDLRRRWRS